MLLNRLKYWREYRGLTLRELAEKSKIPHSAISVLENGKRGAQPRTVRALAAALEVEIIELYIVPQTLPLTLNDNKQITVGRTTRAKKKPTAAPGLRYWVFEKDHEGEEPFKLDNQAQADQLQKRLGGEHQVRVYPAERKSAAWDQHNQFLIRVARDNDYW